MNPVIYLATVIDAVSLLLVKFYLDYVEAVSILKSFATVPHTTFYFIISLLLIYYAIEDYRELLTSNRYPLHDARVCQLIVVYYFRKARTMNFEPKQYPLYFKLKGSVIKKYTFIKDTWILLFFCLTILENVIVLSN